MTAQQLKNAILQEAIEGRLVPQDPNDEPASILLERIRAEKERLVKEGKLKKKDLEVNPISEDEIPFEIPKGWVWVRFGTITINRDSERIPLSVDERSRLEKKYDYYGASGVIDKVDRYLFNKPLLLIGEDGANLINRSTPIAFIAKGVYWVNNHAHVLDYLNEDLMQYMCWYINAISLVDYVTGTAQPKMNQEKMNSIPVALPPLAEQKRIVAKIEELLPKVEKYGKAQEELNKLNEGLPERLRKSFLQEAIEGRLVPQDPNDEPVSVLLEKIREEKKQLVKEGKLKKKDLEEIPISEDEIPFEIPDSWEWCRLGDIGIFERGNGIKRDETFESGYPCVRYGEMYTKYKYAPTFDKTVSFTSESVFEKCRKAHKGDLFMALTGENKQDISLAAQYVGEEEIAVGGDLCHFTILEAYALYFVYLINSTYFSGKKELLATGDIIVHISTDKLASIPIPLPPLAEQKRIVAKIEELLQKIDGLKK